MKIILIYFSIKYEGDWDKIYDALDRKEKIEHKELIQLERQIEKEGWNIVTILDKEYPRKLQSCYKPPFVLWYEGDLETLDLDSIVATGDDLNDKVQKNVETFLKDKKDEVIGIMNFKGVDKYTMQTNEKLYFVAPSGIDKYKAQNKEATNHLIISEYPYGSSVKKNHFSSILRVYASLSEYLVLFTSKKDGGINASINNFLNLGKEIYCYPGDGSENDGNTHLIKQGANIITHYKDIK